LSPAELIEERGRGALVLDTRPAEQFAAVHIRGSVQISLPGSFSSWAAILIDPMRALVLVAEQDERAYEAYHRLRRVGLDRIIGYTLADERGWREAGLELASIAIRRCADVSRILRRDPSVQLVDVRSRAEWLKGHLPGAISMPLLDLRSTARSIDPSRRSLVYCHQGYRATTAASILLNEQADVAILIDGIEGWSAAGLALEVARQR
jgi:rhodanese-related sulfurtransferase